MKQEFTPTRPEYYHKGGIDVFTYIEANLSFEEVRGFYKANIIKYITRYNLKNGIEDLEKAEVYQRRLYEWELKKIG